MSTWQIFTDAGRNTRWEVSGKIVHSDPSDGTNADLVLPHSPYPRLPSVVDLLRQGGSKLLEIGDECAGNTPIFRTGFGKSVTLKQSSIAKALSVLGEDYEENLGEACARDNECSVSNSLFCTGSGKSVNISSAGLMRAKTLLDIEEDGQHLNFQGFRRPRESSTVNEHYRMRKLFSPEMKEGSNSSHVVDDSTSIARESLLFKNGLLGSEVVKGVCPNLLQSEMHSSASKPPPIRFQTAGGRSLSVSTDALERARSLLGDPDVGTLFIEENGVKPPVPVLRETRSNDASSNNENNLYSSFTHPVAAKSKHISKDFISPLKSSSGRTWASFSSGNTIQGSSLIKKFDEVVDESICQLSDGLPAMRNLSCNLTLEPNIRDIACANGTDSRTTPLIMSSRRPLVDISNTTGTCFINNRHLNGEKRRLGRGASVSSFKRPRSLKFTTPLNRTVVFPPIGLSSSSSQNSNCRRVVSLSSKYPVRIPRIYIKEYFGEPLLDKNKLRRLTSEVRRVKSNTADNYRFCDESSQNGIGAAAFYDMLAQSGASLQDFSKQWVINHYRWIIWKLSCYERYRPMKSVATFLTVPNVLEELKYRYEREVNQGHRSAIKRILAGEVAPSSMLVLCVSAINVNRQPDTEIHSMPSYEDESSNSAYVELTDGWYSIGATLDLSLSKLLASGKIFIGQKLRIWGAGLRGWDGPISPLQASKSISLVLHVNGTYRAHWADRLGLCKHVGAPLAFRCIKSNGGLVPQTLVGVTRIYPVLYKEKLINGGSIVRSERMEAKISQLYNQRRAAVIEGVASEFETGMKDSQVLDDSDCEEGAKILKLLETSAEPEVLMAEMNTEQLTSFASYQAKLEATRQSDMEKAVQKALQDAGLGQREVTPFMRVRVVGLTKEKEIPNEGLITIWNPTEKQQSELVEGQAYAMAGLLPVNSDSKILYLQARGSSTKWQPLSASSVQHFQPFFSPRVSVPLSKLGEVPLGSEFDIAAFVVHVGEVHTATQKRKQWVFVSDNSVSISQSEEISNCLLAISFCSPYIDDNSFFPINSGLAGTTVGFCNVIKKAKDQMNRLWIAEATENSVYTFAFDSPKFSHLRSAAATAQSWAKTSGLITHKLKEKVLFIIGDCKD